MEYGVGPCVTEATNKDPVQELIVNGGFRDDGSYVVIDALLTVGEVSYYVCSEWRSNIEFRVIGLETSQYKS